MRKFFLLFSLILFSSFSYSADYYFARSGTNEHLSSAQASCDAFFIVSGGGYSFSALVGGPSIYQCQYRDAYGNLGEVQINRLGDSCPAGGIYNAVAGECDIPKVCPAAGTLKVIGVTCDCSGSICRRPSKASFEGCGYDFPLVITGDGKSYTRTLKNYSDPVNSTCVFVGSSTGLPQLPAEGVKDICPTCIADIPPATDPDPVDPCVTSGIHTMCTDPKQPNCGTRDGIPYCVSDKDKCGTVNGEMVCIPVSNRTCSYVNGVYSCIDTGKDSLIAPTSSDHPDNGGNADGNDRNDPNPAGTSDPATGGTGGGAQGTDSAATNKAISDLQAALVAGLDEQADLLGKDKDTQVAITEPTVKGEINLDEWDEKIQDAKTELKAKSQGVGDLLSAANNWVINGGGGSLSCFVESWGRICLSDYQDHLMGIRYILIFMASILAVYIIFLKD